MKQKLEDDTFKSIIAPAWTSFAPCSSLDTLVDTRLPCRKREISRRAVYVYVSPMQISVRRESILFFMHPSPIPLQPLSWPSSPFHSFSSFWIGLVRTLNYRSVASPEASSLTAAGSTDERLKYSARQRGETTFA